MLATFTLAGEQALLQVAHLGLRQLQFGLQCGVRLCSLRFEFTHNSLVTKFAPLSATDCLAMQSLPIIGGCLQLYMLLLADRHIHAGKGCRSINAWVAVGV